MKVHHSIIVNSWTFLTLTVLTLFESSNLFAQELLKDTDGQIYKTVKIGNRVWMAEDLRTTRYRDGEKLQFVADPTQADFNAKIYTIGEGNSYLYSLLALWANEDGLIPPGWHIPTKDDWDDLLSHCTSDDDLKSTMGWPVEKYGGPTKLECPNCKDWNSEYRRKVPCHTCKDTRSVITDVPVGYERHNGTNRLKFNISYHPIWINRWDDEPKYWSDTFSKSWTTQELKDAGKKCIGCFELYVLNVPVLWRVEWKALRTLGRPDKGISLQSLSQDQWKHALLRVRFVKDLPGSAQNNGSTQQGTAVTKSYTVIDPQPSNETQKSLQGTTAYRDCVDFPIIPGCISNKVAHIQKCYKEKKVWNAMIDGKFSKEFGEFLQYEIKKQGIKMIYQSSLSMELYDALLKKCNQPNEPVTNSGQELTVKSNYPALIFNSSLSYGTVTDIDGNNYKTITIGSQNWMAENLKTTRYNDGTTIPLIENDQSWEATRTPAYSWYGNDPSTYKNVFGALYNFFAVNTGKLCPTGWKVPSFTDYQTLLGNLPPVNQGIVLKEPTNTHWLSSPNVPTNSTGFTAVPAGYRVTSSGNKGTEAYWWLSTPVTDSGLTSPNRGGVYVLVHTNDSFGSQSDLQYFGHSVRCIQN